MFGANIPERVDGVNVDLGVVILSGRSETCSLGRYYSPMACTVNDCHS